METKFFNYNNYFIDEKVNFFQFENEYKVYNDTGANIGAVKQKISVGQKILSMLVNKAMLPFKLDFVNSDNVTEASISRGWTFFLSKISINNSNGEQTAYIKQKFKLFKPTFTIYDLSDNFLAEISGDWKAWNFTIKDASGKEIGTISKKWAGAMQEMFTSADKYLVTIDAGYTDQKNKTAILAGAISIDMILKESK